MTNKLDKSKEVVNNLLLQNYTPILMVKLSTPSTIRLGENLEKFALDISKKTGYEVLMFPNEDETDLTLNIELTIKDKSKIIETNLNIIKLTNDIVQILANFEFSRTDFNIGTGNWQNTTILKDKIKIESNIFLVRE